MGFLSALGSAAASSGGGAAAGGALSSGGGNAMANLYSAGTELAKQKKQQQPAADAPQTGSPVWGDYGITGQQ
jgi:hypothetical protein